MREGGVGRKIGCNMEEGEYQEEMKDSVMEWNSQESYHFLLLQNKQRM